MISNKQRVKLLLQPYLKTKDVAELIGKGKTTASSVVKSIHLELESKEIKTIRGVVSPEAFLTFMKWNLDDLIQKAKIEKTLEI